MTDSQRPGLMHRARVSLGKRLRRLRPNLVPGGFRTIVIAVWILTAALAVVLLFLDPAAFHSEVANTDNLLDLFFAPLWLRMLLVSVIALLAVSATGITALRASLGNRDRRDVVLFEVVLALSLGFPAFAMAADRQLLLATIALLGLIGVEWFAHARAVTSRATPLIPAVACAVALPWLVLLIAQPLGAAGSGGWTWAAIFWFAATFAVFGAYYGIVRASEARANRVHFTKRRDLRPFVAWACIAAVAVLMLARFTVARNLFNESDARLWDPWAKAPMSWMLASVIGTVIAIAAVRSSVKPFRRYGERRVLGVIAGTGVMNLALSWLAIIAGMTVAVFDGSGNIHDGLIDWYLVLQLIALCVLAGIVCLPRFHRTAGRTIVWVSWLYLTPFLVFVVFLAANPPPWYSIGTSVQVAVVLLVVALALAAWNALSANRRVPWRVVVRLAAVPFIVVNAGILFPAILDWSARYILIVGALISIVFLLPRVAADPNRRALDLLGASSAVLLAFAVTVIALPSIFKDETWAVFGTLWLTVTVMTGLVLDLEARPTPATERTRHPTADSASTF